MNDIFIALATHKKVDFPTELDNCYYPMQVGVGDDIADYLRENTPNSDNIAHKNPNFCELTVLYYMWKNVQADIVGLVHYRRYFYVKRPYWQYFFFKLKGLSYDEKQKVRWRLARKSDIVAILNEYDLIIPLPHSYLFEKQTIREQYEFAHHLHDWLQLKEVVRDLYPDYLSVFEKVENGNTLYSGNMFIGKKEIVNEYCQWLFTILFELERRVDISNYTVYQQRLFGFLSERLFTVWLVYHQQKFKIYELKVKNIETDI
ncbi:MAG: DUF4422 domain-containing protein [Neisseria sp.]|nr:DUF4422 domain-containing protein [Neisseria sp.]